MGPRRRRGRSILRHALNLILGVFERSLELDLSWVFRRWLARLSLIRASGWGNAIDAHGGGVAVGFPCAGLSAKALRDTPLKTKPD